MAEHLNRCVFVGLPNSGKSSFIGALWHVVESGEINSLYSVVVHPEDREYLNRLRASFLECVPVERTKTDFVKKIEMEIEDRASGKIVNFIFPDLSGETYESQFEFRKLTREYLDQISECNNIMLFVNPDFIRKGHLIFHVDEMLDLETSNEDNVHKNPTPVVPQEAIPIKEEVKWTPKLCQSQVVLVDLLQMIKNNLKTPCKINVVISAWDIIKDLPAPDGNATPEEWLIQHLPLLYQYLTSNIAKFQHKIYGISSQGGKYSDISDENFDLQAKLKQSERIIVQFGKFVTHDITVPLKWLFE